GQARAARPFPRVGRSIPRATGEPDEWLLLPLSGREDRIRLTDLLRRGRRPETSRPETPVSGRGGQRACGPVHRADGVPRPAKPARQTFRSVSASLGTTGLSARRTRAAQGLNVCRAGFAGRGTTFA